MDFRSIPLEQIEAELSRRSLAEVKRLRERIRIHAKAIEALENELNRLQGSRRPVSTRFGKLEEPSSNPLDVRLLEVLGSGAHSMAALAQELRVGVKDLSLRTASLQESGAVVRRGAGRGTVYCLSG